MGKTPTLATAEDTPVDIMFDLEITYGFPRSESVFKQKEQTGAHKLRGEVFRQQLAQQ